MADGTAKPVHKIAAGDVIATSRGDQKVLWSGSYTATEEQHIYRVIADGREIKVSKHHRTLVGGELMTPHEMQRAGMICASVIEPRNREMFHLVTFNHALVESDKGVWSETLFLGGNQAPSILGEHWSLFAHLHEIHKKAPATAQVPA